MAELSDNFVIKSLHSHVSYPKCDIWTYLEKSMKENASKIALDDPLERRTLTFKQTHELAETIASNLLKHGFNPDKPVCIYMSNCIEYILVELAVLRLGGAVSIINPLLMPGEIRAQLNLLQSDFLFCNQTTVNKSIQASFGTAIKKIFSKEEHAACIHLSTLYTTSLQKIDSPDIKLDSKQRTAFIPFSSGTTGVPKAVELTHSGIIEVSCYLNYFLEFDKNTRPGIIYQPLSHVYGMQLVISYIVTGRRTIVMQQFDLQKYISLVAEHKVDILFFVPPLAVLFCKSGLSKQYDLSHVKAVMIGAAPLGKDQELEICEVLGHQVKVGQGYGMTETTNAVTMIPSFDVKVPCAQGSVGWPMSNTFIKVIDLETGINLGPNKKGEICIKSNYLMKGYLGNPEATRNIFDNDDWLHSGDIGYYDDSLSIFIVDRLKELIKYKGHQVAPSELEALLLTHPKIADAGVTSVPDIEAGELPCAWIVVKPGMKCSEAEIHDFVNKHVASFKKLRGGVRFVKDVPKSPSGKIMRRILKEQTIAKSQL